MFGKIEFVKTRSFEISWAVFRCAALVKQAKLKRELENSATEVASEFGAFNPYKNNEFLMDPIDRLTNIIKLAEAVGEIQSINAKVLYREINGVADVIRQIILGVNKEKEETLDIEGIFSKPPMVAKQGDVDDPTEKDSAEVRQETAKEEKMIQVGSAMFRAPLGEDNNEESADLPNKNNSSLAIAKLAIQPVQGKQVRQETGLARQNRGKNQLPDLESWQELIFRKIKETGQASTRELTGHFPQISERTIRFYLQKLAEAGLIEKKGNTGPKSYYKLNK